ncbi:hypothetical protein VTJ04DRAFT_5000 [Mycothermus thermophilus]|uniref:uncharacterized protein n=1 Tax=Humicola insolens TaxID=85995 RepID=UPI003742F447
MKITSTLHVPTVSLSFQKRPQDKRKRNEKTEEKNVLPKRLSPNRPILDPSMPWPDQTETGPSPDIDDGRRIPDETRPGINPIILPFPGPHPNTGVTPSNFPPTTLNPSSPQRTTHASSRPSRPQPTHPRPHTVDRPDYSRSQRGVRGGRLCSASNTTLLNDNGNRETEDDRWYRRRRRPPTRACRICDGGCDGNPRGSEGVRKGCGGGKRGGGVYLDRKPDPGGGGKGEN